ncbi:MAG TPA: tetratricopeptide repeat protein [Flavobacterium sp.]|uniref:tetratricopeptide repeat protein n=1 Tax=Flavobacterium sp. TaxID=239 RepID=UPI002B4B5A7D|nr:tetratricopeptide repeat protein [Flavobacterium sp.]HLO74295.1 tetratricopeptide repeat protein [Flavobacterium sp.]
MKRIYPLFLIIFFSNNLFAQEKNINSEILEESCNCIRKIDINLDKLAKNDSIKSCITSFIIKEQTKELLMEMSKTVDTLLTTNKDTTITGGKNYTIIVDKDYDEIQKQLMQDCPYLKAVLDVNNEKHENSLSAKKKANEFYEVGEKYFNKQQYDLALVEFNKAVKNDPKFAFAWDNLGICYRKLNRFKEAINCYEKSLALDPKGKVPLMNMAVAYNLLKDDEKAIETYNKFIQIHPEDPEGYYGIARLQNFTKDYKNGLENALKAYTIYDNSSSPYSQDAISVIIEIVNNLKKENKVNIYNEFAEKHGLEKIK